MCWVYPLGSNEPVRFDSLDAARSELGDDFVTAQDCRDNGDTAAADTLDALDASEK